MFFQNGADADELKTRAILENLSSKVDDPSVSNSKEL
jgi:hypothetical protein